MSPYLGLQMMRPNRKEGESAILSGRERLAAEDVFMPAAFDDNGKKLMSPVLVTGLNAFYSADWQS